MPGRNAVHGVMPPHYLHELPTGDEERLEKIFNKLDLDGNGRIDVHDLSKALHDVGVHKRYAEVTQQLNAIYSSCDAYTYSYLFFFPLRCYDAETYIRSSFIFSEFQSTIFDIE